MAALAALVVAPATRAAREHVIPPVSVPTRDVLLTEARLHLARGRDEEAIYALTRALHQHPDNLAIAYRLADLHYERRDYEEAIRLLRAYLDRSTARRNLYYPLGLCYHKTGKLRSALGAYTRALQIDPGNLRAYVRIAQVRIRQGLPYDARKILDKALAIDPEYLPALEERKVAQKLVEDGFPQVYRKRNMVILFHDPKQFPMVERAFPVLEKARRRLEEELRYHIPVVWVKVENKVRRFQNPPALFSATEDSLVVEAAEMEVGNYEPMVHQLAHMYLHKMTKGKMPHWLAEGIAMDYARPAFLKRTSLRSLSLMPVGLSRTQFVERSYLDFDALEPETEVSLAKAFVLGRFLRETYGLVGLRKLLLTFREGEKDFFQAAWKALHLDRAHFTRKASMYAMRGYYFADSTEPRHP